MNWPNQPEEYRLARAELLEAETELRRREEAVAAQRRALPLGGEVAEEYVFDSPSGPVTFAELFVNGKDTLYLYNFMYIPGEQGTPLEVACPSCTSIIDGMDGAIRHLLERVDVAIVAKAPIGQFAAWGRGARLAILAAVLVLGHDLQPRLQRRVGRGGPAPRSRTSSHVAAGGSTTAGAASCSPRRATRARSRAMSTTCGRSGRCSTSPLRAAAATGIRATAPTPDRQRVCPSGRLAVARARSGRSLDRAIPNGPHPVPTRADPVTVGAPQIGSYEGPLRGDRAPATGPDPAPSREPPHTWFR